MQLRKLSSKHRKLLLYRSRRAMQKRSKYKCQKYRKASAETSKSNLATKNRIPPPPQTASLVSTEMVRGPKRQIWELMEPPGNFSFRNNYHEVGSFLASFRDKVYNKDYARRRFGIDFRKLDDITPGAALVLAAELHRLRVFINNVLIPIRYEEWKRNISATFNQLGLFEFLKVNENYIEDVSKYRSNEVFIKYSLGVDVTPSDCAELLDHLKEIAGPIDAENFIYDGLIEAIKNSKQHAYSDQRWYGVEEGTWLMCGAYNARSGVLTAAVYDYGVGIPYTLPRSGWWEKVKALLATFDRHDDAAMIAAAIEVGRSRTGLSERGKGLPAMLRFFDKRPGVLRILSGSGEVRYSSKRQKIERIDHKVPIGGTLIQWEVYGEKESEY